MGASTVIGTNNRRQTLCISVAVCRAHDRNETALFRTRTAPGRLDREKSLLFIERHETPIGRRKGSPRTQVDPWARAAGFLGKLGSGKHFGEFVAACERTRRAWHLGGVCVYTRRRKYRRFFNRAFYTRDVRREPPRRPISRAIPADPFLQRHNRRPCIPLVHRRRMLR